jgi:hypothetical protein
LALTDVSASLKHLPDISDGREVSATDAIGDEGAAFRFPAQGRYLDPVVEDQLAGIGQGDRIIVGGGDAHTRLLPAASPSPTYGPLIRDFIPANLIRSRAPARAWSHDCELSTKELTPDSISASVTGREAQARRSLP